jgi:hypothetical protein
MLTQTQWDPDNPADKTRWEAQHTPLMHLDPPYVYNVFRDDKEGFVKAVVEASSHPIERRVSILTRTVVFG